MVEQLYNSITKYFKHITNTGYMSYSNVRKLLVFIIIQEMVDEDCFGILNEEDYAAINKALYCLYGSTCLIKYPDYYNPNTRRTMFIGNGDNPPIDPDYPSDLDWNKMVITPLSGTSGVDIIVPYSASSTVSQTIDINKEVIVPYN